MALKLQWDTAIFWLVHKIAKIDYSLRHVCSSSSKNSAPTGMIFITFYIWGFFENLPRKFKPHYNLTRIRRTSYDDLCTFMVISRLILLRMRNVLETKDVEKIKIRCSNSVTSFLKQNRVIYEITWKNTVQPDRPQMSIRYGAGKMRFERRVKNMRMRTYLFIID